MMIAEAKQTLGAATSLENETEPLQGVPNRKSEPSAIPVTSVNSTQSATLPAMHTHKYTGTHAQTDHISSFGLMRQAAAIVQQTLE